MGRIQANTGLVTGIDIQGTVEKLLALQAQPRDRLTAKLTDVKAKQTAVTELTASVIGVQISVQSLGTSATFAKKSISSSNENVLSAAAASSGTAAAGSYQFTSVRLAQTQNQLSRGFASSSTTLGAGTLTFRQGGEVDRGVSLSELNGGNGVERGKIKITDRSGTTAVIDLRFANTIDDVLEAINSNELIDVTATTVGDQIQLVDNTGETESNLRVREVGSSTTAADLGLASVNVAANSATGDDVLQLHNALPLSVLNDGQGLSFNETLADLQITFRDTSSPLNIDFQRVARSAANAVGITNASDGINGDIELTADTVGADYDDVELVFIDSGTVTQGSETVSYNSGTKTLTVDIDAGSTTADDVINAINNDGTAAPLFTAARGTGGDGTGLVSLTDTATLTGGAAIEARSETTLADLLQTINEADPTRLSAEISADGDRLVLHDLTSDSGGTFTVSDLYDGTLAGDLGFNGNASGGTFTGTRLLGGLRSPLLHSLNGGRGFDLGSISITDRSGASTSINLATAETLDDVRAAINNSGLSIVAKINDAHSGLVIEDTSGATTSNLIIANNDVTNSATQLGIAVNSAVTSVDSGSLHLQTLNEGTLLSALNLGEGVPAGSFTITDSAGAVGAINLTQLAAETLGDVIDAINDLSIGVTARINDTGDGLLLTDTASGSGKLKVVDSGTGSAAAQLNIAGEATATTLDGSYALTVEVEADDSLSDVVEKINNLSGGLHASLVNDGTSSLPTRLSLTSTISGSRGNFTFDDGGLGLGISTAIAGRDALLSLGEGVSLLASNSNTFENAVAGLDITLQSASTETVTISVSQDVGSISSKVKLFVDQYNKLQDKLDTYDFYSTSDNKKGVLFGSIEALRISSDLSRVVSKRYFANAEIQSITELGVNFSDDGKLEFNATQFQEAYQSNSAAVEEFFSHAEKGFAAAIDNVSESLAGIDNSALVSSAEALQRKVDQIQERIDFMNARLDRSKERMLTQFYNLETAISKLQNTFGSIQSSLTNSANFFASQSR
jgi:flagellar capping protein FliD